MMTGHADEEAYQLNKKRLLARGISRECGNDPCYAPNGDGEGCERCGLNRHAAIPVVGKGKGKGKVMSESPGIEMPRYRSHKEVRALQIGDEPIIINPDGSMTLPIADVGYAPVTITAEVYSRYCPVAGDFYVVYADGYKSLSPRKAFIDGYTRV